VTQAIISLQARLSACRGVLVDSNVLLDVATNDPGWGDWSARALAEVAEHTTLIINPIIYAEVSIGYTTVCDESVSNPQQRLYIARLVCIVVQCCANLANAQVQTVFEIHKYMVSPDFLAELVPPDDFTWPACQQGQDLRRLRSQPHRGSRLAQFAPRDVQLKRTEASSKP